jgi:hypothetical protein
VSNCDPDRLEGLFPFAHYAEAAARLFCLGELTSDEAWSVAHAAMDEGLDITEAQIDELMGSCQ